MKHTRFWTNEEIVRSYKQAENKVEQVKIIAECTATDADTIIEILRDEGAIEPVAKICRQCGREYKTAYIYGNVCPDCLGKAKELNEAKYELRKVQAHILRLSRKSAELKAKIERLNEWNKLRKN